MKFINHFEGWFSMNKPVVTRVDRTVEIWTDSPCIFINNDKNATFFELLEKKIEKKIEIK